MVGGSYLRMAFWNILGDALKNSAWITSLTKADNVSDTAESLLKAAHFTQAIHS